MKLFFSTGLPIFLGVILLSSAFANSTGLASHKTKIPPQLNISGFAQCLAEKQQVIALTKIKKRHKLNSLDLLLPYLAVYAGKRLPGFDELLQTPAQNRWSGAFEEQEEILAFRLLESAMQLEPSPITPSSVFGMALNVCGKYDGFCAALISHNVLRTLGRHETAFYKSPITSEVFNYNPLWFQGNTTFWLENAPRIQKQLFSLRRDRGGDGWGSWYHFFGLLTFSIHEMAIYGWTGSADFVAMMNQLLNPILAGGKENPHQAKVDKESVQVTKTFFKQLASESLPPEIDCSVPESFRR